MFEGLKRNNFLLGLHYMGDEELVCVLLDSDLDHMEFFKKKKEEKGCQGE